MAFAPDSKTLAAKQSRSVRFWDVASGKPAFDVPEKSRHVVNAVDVSPDGSTLAACTPQGIGLVSLPSQEEQGLLGNPTPEIKDTSTGPRTVVFSPDGRTLAAGCFDGIVCLWDWRSRASLCRIAPENRKVAYEVASLTYSPDGQVLAIGWSNDSEPESNIHLYDPGSGTLLGKLKGSEREGVVALAFSPDGRTLASVGPKESAIHLWDIFSGKPVATLDGHREPVRALAFAPDGATLASGSVDTTILLWDVRGLTPPLPANTPDEKGLEQLWADLQGRNAVQAFQAIPGLVGAGDKATAFLKARVKPVPAPDPQRVSRLLDDLDANAAAVRDAASQELRRLGRAVEGALRQRYKEVESREVKARIERLLEDLSPAPDPAERSGQRAVTVLEQVGTPAARAALKDRAAGADGADLSRAARAALDRLDRRAAASPRVPSP